MTAPQTSWTEHSETQALPYIPPGSPRHAATPRPDPVRVDDLAPAEPGPSEASQEPVIIAHAVTVILGALVTAGWVALPDPTINAIGTVVAIVLSTVGAVLARARVSPVGGVWAAIEGYVADLVATELRNHRLP